MSTPTISHSSHSGDATQAQLAAAGTNFDSGHGTHGSQRPHAAVGPLSPQVSEATTPIIATPAGTNFDSGQDGVDTQAMSAAVEPLSPQARTATAPNCTTPAGDQLPGPATGHTVPNGDPLVREQTEDGAAVTILDAPTKVGTSLADPFLALSADVLDDAEQNRIANQNRLRQLIRGGEDDPRLKERKKDGTLKYASKDDLPLDADGEDRGFGLDNSHPDVARLSVIVDMLAKVEHQATLNLQRMLRQHPLGPWVKAQKGIGDKQAARLLAVIGDPYLGADGRPRTVSQLWAYCGHGDPSRRKFKGMTQADLFTLGNPTAKSRLWLIAGAVLKAQGPLSEVYYDRKEATVGRLHASNCVRCGPSGHPALEGSPWSDAHRHADALRVTGKAILKGLWLEARRIHTAPEEGSA